MLSESNRVLPPPESSDTYILPGVEVDLHSSSAVQEGFLVVLHPFDLCRHPSGEDSPRDRFDGIQRAQSSREKTQKYEKQDERSHGIAGTRLLLTETSGVQKRLLPEREDVKKRSAWYRKKKWACKFEGCNAISLGLSISLNRIIFRFYSPKHMITRHYIINVY